MGARFRLEHANIVAYITSRSYGAPRVLRQDLVDFLQAFAFEADGRLISEPFPEREPWAETIEKVARQALDRLSEIPGVGSSVLPPSTVRRLLEDLQSEFAHFQLFALAVGADDRLQQIAQDLARWPMYGQLLVLIPDYSPTNRNFEVLDPIPAFSRAIHSAPDWPGVLFWTHTGASAFARLEDAEKLGRKLVDAVHDGKRRLRSFFPFPSTPAFDDILHNWTRRNAREYRRLLHLSDLHLGTRDADENQTILDAELRDIVQKVDRVVITGDLFDSPRKNHATRFVNFSTNITHLAGGREPIFVTGNHDQRMFGNFGKNYEQVARIGSQTIVVDDACKMIYICFNSSKGGCFARGRITKSQFRQLGGEYNTHISARPELESYLPVVLVHHHPFSFDVPPETWVQHALSAIGLRDEAFLVLKDAEDLHRWCLDWKIKTILHGHKHKARYVERKVAHGADQMLLTAIGCGSSLGAAGSPVSYNMLEWDPGTRRWAASFFESVNGGAFRETLVAASP